ncbi:MAG: ABC transporter ATP-binding protein [Acidobacteriia bacterium]|nr:ABC transporter ATP-binding protein [Terriglobia bacterium]
MSENVIEVRELTKIFATGWGRKKRVEAVGDLDLAVARGEIFAFLGPNGAGKTTTINLLMGFLRPTRGSIKLFSSPPEARHVRSRTGFLPENYAFYSFLNGPQLLDFFGRLFRIPDRLRRSRIEQLLGQLDLWEARNLRIGKYSRGMRQRLGIAQALLNEPELLILDEPTSGFDPLGRRMVRQLLLQLKQRGSSIFLSSHILSEVEAICDRVAIVNRGKMVRQGSLKEVIGSHEGIEITFTDPGGSVRSQLQELNLKISAVSEQFMTFAGDEALGQHVVDAIRLGGGTLRAYLPVARTLEEVFIDLVGDQERARVSNTAGREEQ